MLTPEVVHALGDEARSLGLRVLVGAGVFWLLVEILRTLRVRWGKK